MDNDSEEEMKSDSDKNDKDENDDEQEILASSKQLPRAQAVPEEDVWDTKLEP